MLAGLPVDLWAVVVDYALRPPHPAPSVVCVCRAFHSAARRAAARLPYPCSHVSFTWRGDCTGWLATRVGNTQCGLTNFDTNRGQRWSPHHMSCGTVATWAYAAQGPVLTGPMVRLCVDDTTQLPKIDFLIDAMGTLAVGPEPVPEHSWVHYAMVWTQQWLDVYINGALVMRVTNSDQGTRGMSHGDPPHPEGVALRAFMTSHVPIPAHSLPLVMLHSWWRANVAAKPRVICFSGVAGAGKTSLGQHVAQQLGLVFVDADAFHSRESIASMRAGTPITDEARASWLVQINAVLRDELSRSGCVLACSALREHHRVALCQGIAREQMMIFQLQCSVQTLQQRFASRRHHFMPPTLLPSQLSTLEPLPERSEHYVGVVLQGDKLGVAAEVMQTLLNFALLE